MRPLITHLLISGKNKKAVSTAEVAHGLEKVESDFGQLTGRLHLYFCTSTTSKKRRSVFYPFESSFREFVRFLTHSENACQEFFDVC